MKYILFAFLCSLALSSCTFELEIDNDESFDFTSDFTSSTLQARQVVQYNNNSSSSISTFSYNNAELAGNNRYTFERNGNTLNIFSTNAGNINRTPDYVVVYDFLGNISQFESNVNGGYFRMLRDNDGVCLAEWKQCGTCEVLSMRFTINDDSNVERVQVFKQNGQLLNDYYYTYDGRTNPFFQNIHLPDQFLTDLEYFVRVFSCNNIVTSTPTDYTYEFDKGVPVAIRAKDNATNQTRLSKEITY